MSSYLKMPAIWWWPFSVRYCTSVSLLQLLEQIQIGVGEGGLSPLNDDTVDLGGEKVLKDLTLHRDLVLGGKKQGHAIVLGENGLDLPQNGGEDIIADIGGDHRDGALRRGGLGTKTVSAKDVGAASPALFNITILLENGEGLTNGLTAHLVFAHQGIFRGEHIHIFVFSVLDMSL